MSIYIRKIKNMNKSKNIVILLYSFGSCIVSENTGILLNDGMDDFSIPERLNYFGIPPNPNNYIAPGKRPLSSMTPTILIDKNGDVQMVIGAAGGTKIITSIAYVNIFKKHLFFINKN